MGRQAGEVLAKLHVMRQGGSLKRTPCTPAMSVFPPPLSALLQLPSRPLAHLVLLQQGHVLGEALVDDLEAARGLPVCYERGARGNEARSYPQPSTSYTPTHPQPTRYPFDAGVVLPSLQATTNCSTPLCA